MKTYAIRLLPKQDIKKKLQKFTKEKEIKAGFIITCVGCVNRVTIRTADETIRDFEKKYEIVSLVGTLSEDGVHLHISLSDKDGNVIGGHIKDGCMVYTTAEIVIGEFEDIEFSREFDKNTGFKELKITEKNSFKV